MVHSLLGLSPRHDLSATAMSDCHPGSARGRQSVLAVADRSCLGVVVFHLRKPSIARLVRDSVRSP